MITWMQHPEHGKHPAQQYEIEALELSGWTLCPPKTQQMLQVAERISDLLTKAIEPRGKIRGNRRATR